MRTDAEVLDIFTPEIFKHIVPCQDSWWVRVKRMMKTGAMFHWPDWIELTKFTTFGDTTFEEAYRRTGYMLLHLGILHLRKHTGGRGICYYIWRYYI